MNEYKLNDESLGPVGKLFHLRGKWLAAGSVALVIAIIGIGSYFITKQKLTAVESPKVVQATQIKKDVDSKGTVSKVVDNKAVVIKQNDNTKVSGSELKVYNTMHKMINTKIVAEDGKIWGEVEITPENCQTLITEVTKSNYSDKDTLLEFLTRWKASNFNSGVDEHNYLWDGLDGTIGKAEALRP